MEANDLVVPTRDILVKGSSKVKMYMQNMVIARTTGFLDDSNCNLATFPVELGFFFGQLGDLLMRRLGRVRTTAVCGRGAAARRHALGGTHGHVHGATV